MKEAGGTAPCDRAIRDYIVADKQAKETTCDVVAHRGRKAKSRQEEYIKSMQAKLQELSVLEVDQTNLTPAFQEKLREIFSISAQLDQPHEQEESDKGSALPSEQETSPQTYDVSLGCPVSIAEEPGLITVTIDPVTEKKMTDYRRYSMRNRWECLMMDGTLTVKVLLPCDNDSEALAIRSHVWASAHRFCRELGAPLPEGAPASSFASAI